MMAKTTTKTKKAPAPAAMTPPPEAQSTTAPSIDDKTLLLSLDFERFGNSRKIADSQYEVGGGTTDKTLTKADAKRLDSETLKAIVNHDSATRRWVESKTLPSLLKSGIFRLPFVKYLEVVTYLEARRTERATLIQEFKVAYPADVTATVKRLGTVAKETDYPSADEAANEFGMSWRFLSSGVPPALQALDPSGHVAEVEAYRKQLTTAAEAYTTMLRVACADFVDHLVDRLTPELTTNGRKKRFHLSNVTNLREFLADFPARNVADDKELAAIVATADKILSGVDLEDIKTDEKTRAYLKTQMETIQVALDPLIVTKAKRKIVLDPVA